jgi:hypothetical protein
MSLGEYRDASSFSRQKTNGILRSRPYSVGIFLVSGTGASMPVSFCTSATRPRTRSCQLKPNNCGVP